MIENLTIFVSSKAKGRPTFTFEQAVSQQLGNNPLVLSGAEDLAEKLKRNKEQVRASDSSCDSGAGQGGEISDQTLLPLTLWVSLYFDDYYNCY